MDQEYKTLQLHFNYCLFIAAMAIIGIATEKWSANKDFTTYLSNAATMTSLLLGIVAIFYSFISNDGMSKSLGSITTVSSEVRGVREEIEHFSNITKEATIESSSNAEAVRDASTNLSKTIGAFSTTLQQLTEQNGTLQHLISALPTRMDQLQNSFNNMASAFGEKTQEKNSQSNVYVIPAEQIYSFLSNVSLSQNLLTYACVLAFERSKDLSIRDFCKAVEIEAPNYYSGFLSCMDSAQFLSYENAKGKDKILIVKWVHQTVIDRSKEYFVEYIKASFGADSDRMAMWQRKLNAVEALFN